MSEKTTLANFRPVSPYDINGNVFDMIDNQWFLLTAGTKDRYNTMTASWGSMGILWNLPVVTCFVRPQRYTCEFMEKQEIFTLSFLNEAYRPALTLCGTQSGRDIDKIAASGLNPIFQDSGAIFFQEASLVLECKKIYFDILKPENFLDVRIMKNYPKNDFHRIYIGEVMNAFEKIR